jgi:predicted nucleic acid-binding protein
LSDQQKTRIAALDAMILTWWMRDDAPQDMKERVQWLVEELEEEKATIIVPTVALSEFLRGIQPKYHGQVIEFFRIRFVLAEFNVQAAAIASRLIQHRSLESTEGKPGARVCMRADAMIVATAISHQATIFYSDDEECRKMAAMHIEAKGLPNMGKELFPAPVASLPPSVRTPPALPPPDSSH